jgi:predicted phage terminase large subunit-like protein
MWDQSQDLYRSFNAHGREQYLDWRFPSGAYLQFAHMGHEKIKYDWKGAQLSFIGWDQLEDFSWGQFSYLLSRGRSTTGSIHSYVRATCNPDPDHWLRRFIDWWIDDDTGLAIESRSGVIRWYVVIEDVVHWADNREELIKEFGEDCHPLSFTFIRSSIFDNPIGMKTNPGYLAYLKGMSKVDRERLLGGNWNIRAAAGNFFRREWFEQVGAAPSDCFWIRYWDRAATEAEGDSLTGPSYTVGLKMGVHKTTGFFFIADVVRFRGSPHVVQQRIKNVASQDGHSCVIGLEQDPGQAGKVEAQALARELAGYRVIINRVSESKGNRAKPLSAQVEAGNVKVVKAPWNDAFYQEYENFDGTDKGHADQVDAGSGAFYLLSRRPRRGVLR